MKQKSKYVSSRKFKLLLGYSEDTTQTTSSIHEKINKYIFYIL